MSAESQKIRRQLLDDCYASFYNSYLFDQDLLGFGIKNFERGIGSGAHLLNPGEISGKSDFDNSMYIRNLLNEYPNCFKTNLII
jgi:hypothetical protein